jgi:hypothetical protein
VTGTTTMVRSPWRGRRLACGGALLRTATLLSILDATREAPRRRLRGGKRGGWGLLLWERRPRQPCSTGPPSVFGQLLWQGALMFFGARWEQENSARGWRVGWVLPYWVRFVPSSVAGDGATWPSRVGTRNSGIGA